MVTDPARETESKIRLGRIGYENVLGHLADPLATFAGHPDDVERGVRIDVLEPVEPMDTAVPIEETDPLSNRADETSKDIACPKGHVSRNSKLYAATAYPLNSLPPRVFFLLIKG